MAFDVRPPRNQGEIRQIEALQQSIWQMSPAEATPYNTLYAWEHAGGLLLCAFDEDHMIGFAAGFRGVVDDQELHWSHIVGVLPAYQAQGIGAKLKFAQRDAVIAQGLDCIAWTFDPLRMKNAFFNVRRLGVRIRHLYPEHYGVMRDGINQGMLSDRFEARWYLHDRQVVACAAGEALPELLSPPEFRLRCQEDCTPQLLPEVMGEYIAVELPAAIDALRQRGLSQVHWWNYALREALLPLFAAGYEIVNISRPQPHTFAYLLAQR